ncbi:MAG: PIN domain-containing protein [Elusimicrobia bacterium]|nr:PIN domain-containing protein [Elusimicrobiota bacterium]
MTFLDSGAFIALWLTQDGQHGAATKALGVIKEEGGRLCTSNFVLDEVVTFVGRRAGATFAASKARGVLESKVLSVLRPDADDERAALALYEKFADAGVGFTDAVSFALMRRYRVRRAFTFDRHFGLAGFTLFPGTERAKWKTNPLPRAVL